MNTCSEELPNAVITLDLPIRRSKRIVKQYGTPQHRHPEVLLHA